MSKTKSNRLLPDQTHKLLHRAMALITRKLVLGRVKTVDEKIGGLF